MDRESLARYCISPDLELRQAMIQMEQSGGKLLLVMLDSVLQGVLSDGDIRRAILRNASLDTPVVDFFQKDPVLLNIHEPKDKAREIMLAKGINGIPVVDPQTRSLHDLILLQEVFSQKQPLKNIPLVIMAGGKGSRLEPFTSVLPKPLIPIREKPLLESLIDRFTCLGVEDVYLILNYKGEMIKAYFEGKEVSANLHYIWEDEYYGTAGGLRLLPKLPTFILSNCDIIVNADYEEIVSVHRKNSYLITILGALQRHVIPYGVIRYKEDGSLEQITEKPKYDVTINTGIYLLEPQAVELIPPHTPFDLPQLIDIALGEHSVGVYPVSEQAYLDLGQWKEYHQSMQVLSRDPKLFNL